MSVSYYKSRHTGPEIDQAVAMARVIEAASNGWIKIKTEPASPVDINQLINPGNFIFSYFINGSTVMNKCKPINLMVLQINGVITQIAPIVDSFEVREYDDITKKFGNWVTVKTASYIYQQDTAPTDVGEGTLWINTSDVTHPVFERFDGINWNIIKPSNTMDVTIYDKRNIKMDIYEFIEAKIAEFDISDLGSILNDHMSNLDIHISSAERQEYESRMTESQLIEKIEEAKTEVTEYIDEQVSGFDNGITEVREGIQTVNSNITSHTSNQGIHITPEEIALWNSKADADHGHNLDGKVKIDASDVVSGTFPISMIPKAAIENTYDVDTDEDRFLLTIDDVQNGDTVYAKDTETFYYVVDDTKLDQEDGYKPYSTGIAKSMQWSNIKNIPNTLSGLGITDAYNKQEIENLASATKMATDNFAKGYSELLNTSYGYRTIPNLEKSDGIAPDKIIKIKFDEIPVIYFLVYNTDNIGYRDIFPNGNIETNYIFNKSLNILPNVIKEGSDETLTIDTVYKIATYPIFDNNSSEIYGYGIYGYAKLSNNELGIIYSDLSKNEFTFVTNAELTENPIVALYNSPDDKLLALNNKGKLFISSINGEQGFFRNFESVFIDENLPENDILRDTTKFYGTYGDHLFICATYITSSYKYSYYSKSISSAWEKIDKLRDITQVDISLDVNENETTKYFMAISENKSDIVLLKANEEGLTKLNFNYDALYIDNFVSLCSNPNNRNSVLIAGFEKDNNLSLIRYDVITNYWKRIIRFNDIISHFFNNSSKDCYDLVYEYNTEKGLFMLSSDKYEIVITEESVTNQITEVLGSIDEVTNNMKDISRSFIYKKTQGILCTDTINSVIKDSNGDFILGCNNGIIYKLLADFSSISLLKNIGNTKINDIFYLTDKYYLLTDTGIKTIPNFTDGTLTEVDNVKSFCHASTEDYIVIGSEEKIGFSTDQGSTWSNIITEFENLNVISIAIHGNICVCLCKNVNGVDLNYNSYIKVIDLSTQILKSESNREEILEEVIYFENNNITPVISQFRFVGDNGTYMRLDYDTISSNNLTFKVQNITGTKLDNILLTEDSVILSGEGKVFYHSINDNKNTIDFNEYPSSLLNTIHYLEKSQDENGEDIYHIITDDGYSKFEISEMTLKETMEKANAINTTASFINEKTYEINEINEKINQINIMAGLISNMLQ